MKYSAYLYGSNARGDASKDSDTDILVICDDASVFDINKIELPADVLRNILFEDISIYSIDRITEMHQQGHLYTWHLYQESKFIAGDVDRIKLLGSPGSYIGFEQDVKPLMELLDSIPSQLLGTKGNSTYEAGLIYICARNIAMAVSYFLPNGLCFKSSAPFEISNKGVAFPLTKDIYQDLRTCRLAGSRGLDSVKWNTSDLINIAEKTKVWASRLVELVGGFNDEANVFG